MNKQLAIQITTFLLRVVSGLLFMQVGGMKMLDWFGGIPAEHGGHPAPWSQIWIGGALLTLGTGLAVLPERRTAPAAVAARALA